MTSTKTKFVVNTKVVRVFNQINKTWVKGMGEDAIFIEQNGGWYVAFDGSYEALFFGYTEPELKVGDAIKITFERV